mgnify:CR=1 FL=1
MGLNAIIDTSVATRLGNARVREHLADAVAHGRIGRTTVTDLEIGFSARSGPEWEAFAAALEVFPLIQIDQADFHLALDVQHRLATQGLRGRKIPDLLIAAAAHRRQLLLLHYDRDFDLIADQTGQLCRWVVPAGSID